MNLYPNQQQQPPVMNQFGYGAPGGSFNNVNQPGFPNQMSGMNMNPGMGNNNWNNAPNQMYNNNQMMGGINNSAPNNPLYPPGTQSQMGGAGPNMMMGQSEQPAPNVPQTRLTVKLADKQRGFYSSLLHQADPTHSNKLKTSDAKNFLIRAKGVNTEMLQKIWLIASSDGSNLDRDQFYVAMRLIAYAQNGMDVSVEAINANIPVALPVIEAQKIVPQETGTDPSKVNQLESQHGAAGPTGSGNFGEMGMGGDLSNFNMNSHGPPVTMGSNLSGLQSNNNIQGFPSTNSNSGFSTNNTMGSFSSVNNPTPGTVSAIPPEEVEKFELYFETTDENKQGFVSGQDAKNILMKSGLPNDVLGLIWNLTDRGKKGKLVKEQFIVAMKLILMAKSGQSIPQALPPSFQQFMINYSATHSTQNKNGPSNSQANLNLQIPAFNIINPPVNPLANSSSSTAPQDKYSSLDDFSLAEPILLQPVKVQIKENPVSNPPPQTFGIPPSNNLNPSTNNSNAYPSSLSTNNFNDYQAHTGGSAAVKDDSLQEISHHTNQFKKNIDKSISNYETSLQDVSTKINSSQESIVEIQQTLNNTLQKIRDVNKNFVADKEKDLEFLAQVHNAYSILNRRLLQETEILQKDMEEIEIKQKETIMNLVNLGQEMSNNLTQNIDAKHRLVSTATQGINEINQHTQRIIQDTHSNNYQPPSNTYNQPNNTNLQSHNQQTPPSNNNFIKSGNDMNSGNNLLVNPSIQNNNPILNIQSQPPKNQQGSIQNISPAGSALPSPQINNLNSQTQNIHNIPAQFTASVNNHPEPINNFNQAPSPVINNQPFFPTNINNSNNFGVDPAGTGMSVGFNQNNKELGFLDKEPQINSGIGIQMDVGKMFQDSNNNVNSGTDDWNNFDTNFGMPQQQQNNPNDQDKNNNFSNFSW